MQTNLKPQMTTKLAVVLSLAAVLCSAQSQNVGAVGRGVSISFQNASGSAGRGISVGFQDAAGTIQVSTNLAAASFTITGPATYTGGGTSFTMANAPAGSYTITYAQVVGYQSPPPQTKALALGGSVSFNGSYQNVIGTVSVSVQPNSATYNLLGPASLSGMGSKSYNALPVGQYTVSFLPIPGYTTPAPQTKTLSANSTIAFTVSYQLTPGTGSLRVQVTPSTATYNVVGPSSFSGAGSSPFASLPVGTYTVTFLPLTGPGIITPSPQTVLLQAGQTVQATGKYLSSVSPPALKTISGAPCVAGVSAVCVSTITKDRNASRVIADVTVSNITGTWYQLDVQFDSPTTTAPNSIVVDTTKIPTAFLIGPFKTITFPGVTFLPGQYMAMNAEKYSIASTSMIAIDIITRGLFGLEIDTSWSGRLDLTLAELQALASTTELGAPGAAVALGLCRDNICRISQLADFVSKASQDPIVWAAVKALVGKIFGPNAITFWSDIGGKAFGEFLSLFSSIPKLAVLVDQTSSSPNFGGFRIEAVR